MVVLVVLKMTAGRGRGELEAGGWRLEADTVRPFLYSLLIAATVAAAACGREPDLGLGPDRPDVLGFDDIIFTPDFGPGTPAQFGRLWLPSDDGVSRQSIAFVRLPAQTEEPGPPIVYLAGGPGGSGIQTGRGPRFPYFRSLQNLGDVILLDQRGTGASTPLVRCTQELAIPTDRRLDRAATAALWVEQARVCADELGGRGVNLDEYNTNQNADDIDALREALGAEQLVLIGYSYGTHLALAYIRRYEDRVAQAVLHGVEGPDHTLKLPSNVQRSLEVIDSLAGEHPALGPRLGGFVDSLAAGLDALEAKPESAMVGDTLVVIGKFDAQLLVANAIGDREEVEELPGALLAVLEFGWAPVAPAVLELKRRQLNSGMSFAMDCASGATAARLAQIASEAPSTILGDAINFPFPEICQAWNVPDLGDAFRTPLTSNVPVLFVSGSVDGRTPPSNAAEVAAGFPNGQQLIVERAGHNELATDRDIIDAVMQFLRGEDVPERVELPPLRFLLPF